MRGPGLPPAPPYAGRVTRLILAAGGGGDAVAATMLHAALYGQDQAPAVILTYAWDRLIVDPVPGPSRPADFTGLRRLTPHVWAVPADAAPKPPHGSTLPRLAAAVPHTLALIDPYQGAVGVTLQIGELIDRLAPESVDLLDVGGDILARGDEPTLRSPLADALTLAACAQLSAPVRLLVAGPGLDGELPAATLADRFGPLVTTFTPAHVETIAPVLDWHPSEATALLAATARGIRGTCEMRDAALPVPLTDAGPTVHHVDLGDAFHANLLACAVVTTTSLDQAEQHSREVCGYSEIDYERTKATWLGTATPRRLDPVETLVRLDEFEAGARARGATHTTFRRLTEALGISGTQREELRRLLVTSRPEQYEAPLWRIAPA